MSFPNPVSLGGTAAIRYGEIASIIRILKEKISGNHLVGNRLVGSNFSVFLGIEA